MPAVNVAEISGWARVARGAELLFGGIGRGASKAAIPLAIGGGGYLILKEAGAYQDAAGRRENPPLQVIRVPTDQQTIVADPRTGSQTAYGTGPAPRQAVGPERSKERTDQTFLWAAAAAAVGVTAIVLLRK